MDATNLKARDVMHAGAQCVSENSSLMDAAKMMKDLDVGCVPICGTDDKLKGLVTDRDIVMHCCAEGRDPAAVPAGELAGTLHWCDADADLADVLDMMETHQIRRIPVIDSTKGNRLVGMISEADLARNISDRQLAEFVEKVYATA
ncbi:CBS domain-containing protein [Yinghuangia sp. ASG 101]|uniref:CBS domain-containing protein n=1 Tax=Yinghuangia sp. ASG 101 TaxID=2896848 RepID=UPI001E40F035|nr:CBS domain-containing protein [Yinghuangia sp. ASG 101]UGQ09738.1 CBS domain-containing protein [Yinghuangia sp. ASG 101]